MPHTTYTSREDELLARFLAEHLPTKEGGLSGKNIYRLLETYDWANSHSWQSWRDHVIKNERRFKHLIAQARESKSSAVIQSEPEQHHSVHSSDYIQKRKPVHDVDPRNLPNKRLKINSQSQLNSRHNQRVEPEEINTSPSLISANRLPGNNATNPPSLHGNSSNARHLGPTTGETNTELQTAGSISKASKTKTARKQYNTLSEPSRSSKLLAGAQEAHTRASTPTIYRESTEIPTAADFPEAPLPEIFPASSRNDEALAIAVPRAPSQEHSLPIDISHAPYDNIKGREAVEDPYLSEGDDQTDKIAQEFSKLAELVETRTKPKDRTAHLNAVTGSSSHKMPTKGARAPLQPILRHSTSRTIASSAHRGAAESPSIDWSRMAKSTTDVSKIFGIAPSLNDPVHSTPARVEKQRDKRHRVSLDPLYLRRGTPSDLRTRNSDTRDLSSRRSYLLTEDAKEEGISVAAHSLVEELSAQYNVEKDLVMALLSKHKSFPKVHVNLAELRSKINSFVEDSIMQLLDDPDGEDTSLSLPSRILPAAESSPPRHHPRSSHSSTKLSISPIRKGYPVNQDEYQPLESTRAAKFVRLTRAGRAEEAIRNEHLHASNGGASPRKLPYDSSATKSRLGIDSLSLHVTPQIRYRKERAAQHANGGREDSSESGTSADELPIPVAERSNDEASNEGSREMTQEMSDAEWEEQEERSEQAKEEVREEPGEEEEETESAAENEISQDEPVAKRDTATQTGSEKVIRHWQKGGDWETGALETIRAGDEAQISALEDQIGRPAFLRLVRKAMEDSIRS